MVDTENRETKGLEGRKEISEGVTTDDKEGVCVCERERRQKEEADIKP